MLRLRLYKFLGRFIPYFKAKASKMSLDKLQNLLEQILESIDTTVYCQYTGIERLASPKTEIAYLISRINEGNYLRVSLITSNDSIDLQCQFEQKTKISSKDIDFLANFKSQIIDKSEEIIEYSNTII